MTPRGVTLGFAAVVAWLVGRILGVDQMNAIAVTILAALAMGVLYVRLVSSNLSTRRLLPAEPIVAGATIDGVVEVRNDGRVPTPSVLIDERLPATMRADGAGTVPGEPDGTVRFITPAVAPDQVAAARYRLLATTRGRCTIGPLRVRLRDPLGLAERVRPYSATSDVVVYPRITPLRPRTFRGIHWGPGADDSNQVLQGGEDFYGVREYVSGDDMRHVHWPSTAHRQTLMVRQMEQRFQPHATVLLDTRRLSHTPGPHGTFEEAVAAAASLLYHLADHRYALRHVDDTTTGRVDITPWDELLDHLAVVEPSSHPDLDLACRSALGGDGLCVAIVGVAPGSVPPARHADVAAMRSVRGFRERIAVIVAERAVLRRAEDQASVLQASGWKAVVTTPGEPLQAALDRLATAGGRRRAAATTVAGGGTP